MHDADCWLLGHNISVFSVCLTCTFFILAIQIYKSPHSIFIPAKYDIKYRNIEYEIEGPAM